MIVEKQHAWDLRKANLEFEYAEDHIGRRIQERKRDVHRQYSKQIQDLELQLKAEEIAVLNLQKVLETERNFRDYDIKLRGIETRCIGKWANLFARHVYYRWDIKACDAMVANLEEDLMVGAAKVDQWKNEISDLREEELKQHVDLNRESSEMLAMVRIDVGEEILNAQIQDAIELPYVSDSDSGEGSAWDSDDDVIDVAGGVNSDSDGSDGSSDSSSL